MNWVQKTPLRAKIAPVFVEANPAIKIPKIKQLRYLFILNEIYRNVVDRFKFINDFFQFISSFTLKYDYQNCRQILGYV